MCVCGRNLARVHHDSYDPAWTGDGVVVSPNPNVRQDEYRPWHEANQAGTIGTPERAAATPGQVEGVDFDWHSRTYTWSCRCGRTISRRHERIRELWARVSGTTYDRSRWSAVLSD